MCSLVRGFVQELAQISGSPRKTEKSRCGGMVDATDLKSVLAKVGYGFESHHRHRLKSRFSRGEIVRPVHHQSVVVRPGRWCRQRDLLHVGQFRNATQKMQHLIPSPCARHGPSF